MVIDDEDCINIDGIAGDDIAAVRRDHEEVKEEEREKEAEGQGQEEFQEREREGTSSLPHIFLSNQADLLGEVGLPKEVVSRVLESINQKITNPSFHQFLLFCFGLVWFGLLCFALLCFALLCLVKISLLFQK